MSNELEKFDTLKADIALLVSPVMKLKAIDAKSAADVVAARNQVYELSKKLEAARKQIVEPLNDRVKFINSYVKNIKESLDSSEFHLSNEARAFAIKQEEIRQAELRKAEEIRVAEERKARAEAQKIAAEQEAERQAEISRIREKAKEAEDFFGAPVDTSAQIREAEEQAERDRLETEARLDRESQQRQAAAKQAEYDANQNQLKNVRKTWKVKVKDISIVPKEFLIIELNEKFALAARASNPNIPGLEFFQETSVARGNNSYVPKALLDKP